MSKVSDVGIVGYGRFGKFLHSLLKEYAPECSVAIHSIDEQPNGATFFPLEEVATARYLVLSVPIRNFEECLQSVAAHVSPSTTVLDVCSVKKYPKEKMLELLPEPVSIICSHPMFGPATYEKESKLTGLRVVLENVCASHDSFTKVHKFCEQIGLTVVEMDADEHDRIAAHFHFLSLSVAAILKPLKLAPTQISTASADVLVDFLNMVSTDESLLVDMHEYNPYCEVELKNFQESIERYLQLFR